ncbi:ABC transporter permease [Hazenella coriacea]|nr:FtsX-like permease family protein [Hazenella coriacea]
MIGSMVGTALITSALLLQTSIEMSIDQYFDKHFGPIYSDIYASQQKDLHRDYFEERDLKEIEKDIFKQSEEFKGFLPVNSLYGTLLKVDSKGKPILLQPAIYLKAFDLDLAKQFDPKGMKDIQELPTKDEMILSKATADHLELKVGDSVQLQVPEKNPVSLKVKQIVPEQGLTGYRGSQNGTGTGMISMELAQELTGISTGYTNVLVGSNPQIEWSSGWISILDDWEQYHVFSLALNQLEGILKFIPLFVIASVNAIIIGIVLMLNIYKMIADERRREMGMLRAVGMKRKDLVRMLRLEGMIYALGSSFLGTLAGIGISKLILQGIGKVFQQAIQYQSQLNVQYQFYIDAPSLITGFSIGILLGYISMVWIAWRATKTPIVQLLQDLFAIKKTDGNGWNQTLIQTLFALCFGMISLVLVVITMRPAYQVWLEQHEQQAALVQVILSLTIIISSILFVFMGLPFIYKGLQKMMSFSSRLYGVLGLAFRYPQLNKKRTLLLLSMFTMVLFMTGFSGIINATFAPYFAQFDPRKATGGFDVLAETDRALTQEQVDQMIKQSSYIKQNDLSVVTVVHHFPLESDRLLSRELINGVDERFVQHQQIKLLSRDDGYTSDQQVWNELKKNPEVVIISESINMGSEKKYQVGDLFEVAPGVSKKMIGIAETSKESYGFATSQGVWIHQSELDRIAQNKLITTTILFKVQDSDRLAMTAKEIEKEMNQQGIYPTRNPQQLFVASQSFIRVLLSLLEGFSALATVIGIVGLMVVMFRVVRERRQQIGMLRAMGVHKSFIFWSMILEGTVIAMTGILLGLLLGTYVGITIIQTVLAEGNTTIPLVFPYLKSTTYVLVSLFMVVLCSALPARQTLRLTPVEATRYVS